MQKEFWKMYGKAWEVLGGSLLLAFFVEFVIFTILRYQGYWIMNVVGFVFGLVQIFTCYFFYKATLLLPIKFKNKFVNVFSRVLFFGINIFIAYIIGGISVLIFIVVTGITV